MDDLAAALRRHFTADELAQLVTYAELSYPGNQRSLWQRLATALTAASRADRDAPHPYIEHPRYPGQCANDRRGGPGFCWQPADHADHATTA